MTTEEQIVELQSQLAFQEDSIQQLSDALFKQQRRADGLEQRLEQLQHAIERLKDNDSDSSLDNQPPPHY